MLAEGLKKSEYLGLPPEARLSLWIGVMSEGLGISREDARQKLAADSSLPLRGIERVYEMVEFLDGSKSSLPEGVDVEVFPRLTRITATLAQMSPFYDGPRGPRPTLVTWENILRLAGVPKDQRYFFETRLRATFKGFDNYLLGLKLTASNPHLPFDPNTAPDFVQFHHEDIRSGVYVPRRMDAATARALGIIHASGAVDKHGYLMLHYPQRDQQFLQGTVSTVMEEAFNLIPREPNRGQITYPSKAVSTYLANGFQFTFENRVNGTQVLAERIKGMETSLQNEFLKYYLASCGTIDGKGSLRISGGSKRLLEDIRDLLLERVSKKAISVVPNGKENFAMCISTIPTLELYFRRYLNINPRLKESAAAVAKQTDKFKGSFRYLQTHGIRISPKVDRSSH